MMGDNLHMIPHSMGLTQSPSTIVSVKRRNLGRASNALQWSALSNFPQMVSGEEQARNVPFLDRTIFTVQTVGSTRLVDNAFNKLSQDPLENHTRRGQSRIYRQKITPSGQKSSEVCAELGCRICDSNPPTRETNRCIRRPDTRRSRVSIALEGSNPPKWEASLGSHPDPSQRRHSQEEKRHEDLRQIPST